MLVFLYNLVYSQLFARVRAPANPWGSKSLEFQLPSPVPVHDFDRIPVILGRPVRLRRGGQDRRATGSRGRRGR